MHTVFDNRRVFCLSTTKQKEVAPGETLGKSELSGKTYEHRGRIDSPTQQNSGGHDEPHCVTFKGHLKATKSPEVPPPSQAETRITKQLKTSLRAPQPTQAVSSARVRIR